MTITREQVADLREGDVVELGFSSGAIVRGPLVEDRHAGGLDVAEAGWSVRQKDGGLPYGLERIAETLTVVSRAPRPLYVNHPRTEPVVDDIVNYGVGYDGRAIGPFMYTSTERWAGTPQDGCMTRWVGLPGGHPDTGPIYNAGKLRLLVDGETGRVVQ